jgi:hypothetical protein
MDRLPSMFSTLQKDGSWPDVDVAVIGTPKKGRYKIDANGAFLFFSPAKSNGLRFCFFMGNLTPVPDKQQRIVKLQDLDFPSVVHTLTFSTNEVGSQFLAFYFACLEGLQKFALNIDLSRFNRKDQLSVVLCQETKPTNVCASLEGSGSGWALKLFAAEDGSGKGGSSFPVSKQTHVAPLLDVPKHLEKRKADCLLRVFSVCNKDFREMTECWAICKDAQEMMLWVVLLYLANVLSQIKRAPQFAVLPQYKGISPKLLRERLEKLEEELRGMIGNEVEKERPEAEVSFEDLDGKALQCPFLNEMRQAGNSRRLILVALLFASGIRSEGQFAEAVSQLPSGDGDLSDLAGTTGFHAAVSRFVSGVAARGRLNDVLGAIVQSPQWQRQFYLVGSIVRYPWVIEQARGFLREVTAVVTDDLLADVSDEDELRYLKHLPFEFLLLTDSRITVTLNDLVRHLENGLKYDGLYLTKGPWALISAIAKSGKASAEFTATFEEVDSLHVVDPGRKFASKLEDFLQRGIETGRIGQWIREMSSCVQFVEQLYESDATIRDEVRMRVLVNALAR